ncbi:hypothetical protein [Picrophilus oshimae]|uniref:Chorismate synthase n=1 Tax=Picrophilus torridus (strain ATCC 700027 / DSM 9790 / JCM 10055 / NBRC 100828 / KAW 2/3) TaxID=1122961 RepID=A0A8G2FWM7_PICTO|nr:hypothetical protein [Picrophilus oshimae]SMD30826.1 chorismate synthase [Picrophilus oshimae DSM 9789]
MDIDIVKDPDDVKFISNVIRSAWHSINIEGQFIDTVRSMIYHGGFVIIAKENNEIIGMSFSYPGYRNGKTYLYSHMTGVIEDKKRSGIGYMLKMKQRELALNYGYDLIAWTFDPYMALNAYFNIEKLGCLSRTYIDNFYGTMDDGLNNGLPTDRLVCEWYIKDFKKPDYNEYNIINKKSRLGSYEITEGIEYNYENPAISIPYDFQEIKKNSMEIAMDWKLRLRPAFKKLFGLGYAITHFDKKTSSYIFQKVDLEKNIF